MIMTRLQAEVLETAKSAYMGRFPMAGHDHALLELWGKVSKLVEADQDYYKAGGCQHCRERHNNQYPERCFTCGCHPQDADPWESVCPWGGE